MYIFTKYEGFSVKEKHLLGRTRQYPNPGFFVVSTRQHPSVSENFFFFFESENPNNLVWPYESLYSAINRFILNLLEQSKSPIKP